MNIYYNVKLDKKTEGIEKIKHPKFENLDMYFLSNIENYFNHDIKVKKVDKIVVDNNKVLTFAFDCENILKEKNKIFRKIKNIKKWNNKEIFNNCFQVIVFNYNKNNEQHVIDLIRSIKIMLLPTKLEKYDYIYDTVCDYLDNEFISKNICEFKNNKCIAKKNFDCTCGCCRHYKNLLSNKLVECEYLKNKKCSTKCLICKMFTCNYIIKNKKIKYRIKDIFLLNKFFNPIQKLIISISYFTSKEIIIKRLLIWN